MPRTKTTAQRVTSLEAHNTESDKIISTKEIFARIVILETNLDNKFNGSIEQNNKTTRLFRNLVNWIFFGLLLNALLSLYIIYLL